MLVIKVENDEKIRLSTFNNKFFQRWLNDIGRYTSLKSELTNRSVFVV